ncbi:MAG: M48 family metalloprotease [bacterium]
MKVIKVRRKIIKQDLWFILAASVITFLGSCATNPVTGKKELSMLSRNQKIQLGNEADRQISAIYGLYVEDSELPKYIEKIGEGMARISHRPLLKYHFRVLDSPVVNAFAVPGGFVYVTRGLRAYLNSEAELSGVIGHEIGHITAKPGVAQYSRAQLTQIGFGLGYTLFPVVCQFGDLLQFGVGVLFLQFSREQESQSDSLGVEYSSRIGYDATQVPHFFTTIRRLSAQNGQDLPTWLSTHPDPVDREAATLRMAKRWQQELPPFNFQAERERYLDLIAGLVFGEEPRQGFVENGYFYHPILDFQFPFPAGWQLTNAPQQVQIVNRNQTAAIQLTVSRRPRARTAAEELSADS